MLFYSMPPRPLKPCAHKGCALLTSSQSGRCNIHQVKPGSFSDSRRGSAASRGYGAGWRKLREQVMHRDGGQCVQCMSVGRFVRATAVDHIKPKSQGGTDDLNNLQAICNRCHDEKTAKESQAAVRDRGGW